MKPDCHRIKVQEELVSRPFRKPFKAKPKRPYEDSLHSSGYPMKPNEMTLRSVCLHEKDSMIRKFNFCPLPTPSAVQGLRTQCCMFESHLPLEPGLDMDKGRDRVHDGTHKVAKVVAGC